MPKNPALWTDEEYQSIGTRIIALPQYLITALINLAGPTFAEKDIEHVSEDIKKNGFGSGHLSIIAYEAQSKEKLIWWVDYLEKHQNDKL